MKDMKNESKKAKEFFCFLQNLFFPSCSRLHVYGFMVNYVLAFLASCAVHVDFFAVFVLKNGEDRRTL